MSNILSNNPAQLLPFLFIILCLNSLVYLISFYKKDNSLADIFYSFAFMLPAFVAIIFSKNINWVKILIFTFVIIWGSRLFWRIYTKNKNKPEDFRYAKWRAEWSQKGNLYFYTRSYLQVFMLQGSIAFIIMFPALYLLSSEIYYPNTMINIFNLQNIYFFVLGLFMWVFGFIFESVGDAQLDNFLRDKAKLAEEKIMTSGLWKYVRHPNYFGEASMWWGIFFISLGYFNNFNSLIFIISPLLITYLLRHVSGVPMLEKKWDESTDTETKNKWQKYKNKTPAMLPKFW